MPGSNAARFRFKLFNIANLPGRSGDLLGPAEMGYWLEMVAVLPSNFVMLTVKGSLWDRARS
jgi:hypothetical protein